MSQNQRQYFRCHHSTIQSDGLLVVGRRKIPCHLVEMSLGGFAVIVSRALPAMTAPLANLKVRGLEYIVRVTRQEPRDDGVLVALEQLEEVLPNPSLIPSTPLGIWLTRAAWVAAIALVIAAIYSLSSEYAVAIA
jgi:hypothetical protein